jgi:two-component system, NtrC family, nitrogen regulation response regulator GlnG
MEDRQTDTDAPKETAPGRRDRRASVEIAPIVIPFVTATEIPGMVGDSARMRQLAAEIIRKAKYDYDVLLEGETGTGKTLAASAIVWASARSGKPFIKINSASFQKDLFESELFGHEKGAFTGAHERRVGMLEAGDGGTLLFDEVGEMPLSLQAKLLTALEEKRFYRVGGREPVKCDVRILYATKRDLKRMIGEGTFREDLYYRISTLKIRVPSLDERRDDIPALVRNALEEFARRHEQAEKIRVEERAMAMLLERAWPGNIRELQHAVTELAVALDGRMTITPRDVEDVLGPNAGTVSVGERDYDAKTISPPAYLIGEDVDHYLDRTLICIYNTLLNQTGSKKRAADIMKADAHTLGQRLKRTELRLRAAAESARLVHGQVEGVARVRRLREEEAAEEQGELPM